MATKKTKVNKNGKSKVNNTPFFKWWMAVILVVIVALIGIVVVRFSEASSSYYEMNVVCREGVCASLYSYTGKLYLAAGSQPTRVTVFADQSCSSGYRYSFANLRIDVARYKWNNKDGLRCLS